MQNLCKFIKVPSLNRLILSRVTASLLTMSEKVVVLFISSVQAKMLVAQTFSRSKKSVPCKQFFKKIIVFVLGNILFP